MLSLREEAAVLLKIENDTGIKFINKETQDIKQCRFTTENVGKELKIIIILPHLHKSSFGSKQYIKYAEVLDKLFKICNHSFVLKIVSAEAHKKEN